MQRLTGLAIQVVEVKNGLALDVADDVARSVFDSSHGPCYQHVTEKNRLKPLRVKAYIYFGGSNPINSIATPFLFSFFIKPWQLHENVKTSQFGVTQEAS